MLYDINAGFCIGFVAEMQEEKYEDISGDYGCRYRKQIRTGN